MDLAEGVINQDALLKGGARKFSAKSACPNPLRARKRFRVQSGNYPMAQRKFTAP
jgi:hypothetical protein